jgi:hypothetical protein
MINTPYAVAVAAIAAALFVAFPSLSPQVGAVALVAGAKGDRADIRPLGVDCGEKAWPYFDAAARVMDAFHWLSRVTFVSLRPSASPMPIPPTK